MAACDSLDDVWSEGRIVALLVGSLCLRARRVVFSWVGISKYCFYHLSFGYLGMYAYMDGGNTSTSSYLLYLGTYDRIFFFGLPLLFPLMVFYLTCSSIDLSYVLGWNHNDVHGVVHSTAAGKIPSHPCSIWPWLTIYLSPPPSFPLRAHLAYHFASK